MADLNSAFGTFQQNGNLQRSDNWYTFEKIHSPTNDMYQDHKKYSGSDFYVGLNNVFAKGNCESGYMEEPVGAVFFSEKNVKRLQRLIKEEIKNITRGKIILEEDQDTNDVLVAMRAVYMMYGTFSKNKIVHQVKELNKKFISYVVPDMLTEIKQYYGYMKDVNEPLKPIDRPMNVSNAGRRTLPSLTTVWNLR